MGIKQKATVELSDKTQLRRPRSARVKAFLAMYVTGMSVGSICEKLGMSAGEAKNLVYRYRRAMEEEVKRNGIADEYVLAGVKDRIERTKNDASAMAGFRLLADIKGMIKSKTEVTIDDMREKSDEELLRIIASKTITMEQNKEGVFEKKLEVSGEGVTGSV